MTVIVKECKFLDTFLNIYTNLVICKEIFTFICAFMG